MPGSKSAWLRYITNYSIDEKTQGDILDNIANNLFQGIPVGIEFIAELLVLYIDVDALIFSGANYVTLPNGDVADVLKMREAKNISTGDFDIDYKKFNK